ncbi:SAM-dependent methyltransferase [Nitrobacteraceae bacterium AZCC 1564]
MTDRNRSSSNSVVTDFPLSRKTDQIVVAFKERNAADVADIYNKAGDDYATYADGDPAQLFAFDGMHAYADRQLWHRLEAKLVDLRSSGARAIRILDAGCGPGTWLRRLVLRAYGLGFSRIEARGFDIAHVQIERARFLAQPLLALPGITLTFDVADLTGRLPEADASVDMTLCLYSVLSHLPVLALPKIAAELGRVTAGHFVTTVRPVGSPPTAFVDSIEKVRRLRQDHTRNRCEIELHGGRRITFGFHLFTAAELRDYFSPHLDIENVSGLDLFHTRFMPDPRWNLPNDSCHLSDELAQLEIANAANPELINSAAHLLLIGRRRKT